MSLIPALLWFAAGTLAALLIYDFLLMPGIRRRARDEARSEVEKQRQKQEAERRRLAEKCSRLEAEVRRLEAERGAEPAASGAGPAQTDAERAGTEVATSARTGQGGDAPVAEVISGEDLFEAPAEGQAAESEAAPILEDLPAEASPERPAAIPAEEPSEMQVPEAIAAEDLLEPAPEVLAEESAGAPALVAIRVEDSPALEAWPEDLESAAAATEEAAVGAPSDAETEFAAAATEGTAVDAPLDARTESAAPATAVEPVSVAQETALEPEPTEDAAPVESSDSVLLLLVRHGEAGSGGEDAARELTQTGRREIRVLSGDLQSRQFSPVVIRSSPLRRTRQTAETIFSALAQSGPVESTGELAPGARVDTLLGLLRREQSGTAVCWVGHMPDVGVFAAHLLGLESEMAFRPGSALALRVDPHAHPPAATQQWSWRL